MDSQFYFSIASVVAFYFDGDQVRQNFLCLSFLGGFDFFLFLNKRLAKKILCRNEFRFECIFTRPNGYSALRVRVFLALHIMLGPRVVFLTRPKHSQVYRIGLKSVKEI